MGHLYKYWSDHNNKGSRTLAKDLLEYEGINISRNKARRIMKALGIKGIIPKSNLSKVGNLKYKHPYLLSGMFVYMANQVWATDITYVNLSTGRMYVICLLDVYSRYVVGYTITNTLDTSGCIECFTNALQFGKPLILNSDQGSQFTSYAWINLLQENAILISMDAKGRWADNVYVERFWRTLKYECIFMLGVETAEDLHTQVRIYIDYYNRRRLHSALNYKTPESVYLASLQQQNICALFCKWPAEEERVRQPKKMVMPTTMKPGIENYCAFI